MKAGAKEGILISGLRREHGNDFQIIFQGLFIKFLMDVFWVSFGGRKIES